MPRLPAGASLQVCEAFGFQVHVHVIEAKPGPAVGRGHVRETSWEQLPVQVAEESTHPLHREADTAPVDIRHEEVRDPMQVHLGQRPPGGGLVLVFLHQDLPLRGAGQVRSLVGELITEPWAVVGGGRSIGLVGSSPGANQRAARAAEGGTEALPRPRVDLPPSLAQRLGRGDRNLQPPVALHSHHASLGLGAGRPFSLACGKQGQHLGGPGAPDVVPVRSISLALGEDHACALPHPVPKPATSPRETGSDILQGRGRNTPGGQPGPT